MSRFSPATQSWFDTSFTAPTAAQSGAWEAIGAGSNALVDHGTTGFLAPPGASATFLDYVARLVTDASLRHEMGAAALALAHTFEWDAILARIAGYYDEVLNPVYAGDGFTAEPSRPAAPSLAVVPA